METNGNKCKLTHRYSMPVAASSAMARRRVQVRLRSLSGHSLAPLSTLSSDPRAQYSAAVKHEVAGVRAQHARAACRVQTLQHYLQLRTSSALQQWQQCATGAAEPRLV